ncbi:MAG TPA: S9 family peptidase [Gemmatimonadales bacterium]|nr:S9 family peptidase [Gemmatimonadales bacterium]
MRRSLFACAILALLAPALNAQLPDSVAATLHRIFASSEFSAQRFGPARWIEGGNAYTTLERAPDSNGYDIVRYATKSGERSILVSARELIPSGDSTPLGIADYAWSGDNTKLLVFTNTRRVWRQNTRGDYWVLDRTAHTLKQVGGDAPASTLMYAKFSPQGDRVAYVRQGDLYVERLADGAITRLTTGADSLHVNGMSDWVYEEEFGLRDGFRWSPDGTRIAYWHFDMTGVRTFLLINDTDSLYPFVIPIQYPKVGTTNSAVTAGVVSANGGATTWLQVPGDPRNNYLPWMEWAGPSELLLQRIDRIQHDDAVDLADATTGAVRTVMTERDSAWVDLQGDVPWLKDGQRFLWTSERDGWRHAYLVSRKDGAVQLVTRGAFDVMDIAAIDEAGGWLYYLASPTNATQMYLYRSRLNGKGGPERVTPADEAGSHRYTLSPDAKWAFHSWSTYDSPGGTDLVSLPKHDVVRDLAPNTALIAKTRPWVRQPVEPFKVALADGATLDGWMIKPVNFDSTKKYPILMYVYGEPAGATVRDAWMGTARLWYQMIADQGYLVASVDNRGTPAPKGRAWRKVVYKQIGVLSSAEQADAVRMLAQNKSYVDATRVAIWGWSGGASSTLQAMFRYPKVYKVGMSVAPVPDQRLYDTIYQERYMGLLPADSAAYDSASPIGQAQGLQGSLLLVHGSGDDNVHFQGSQRLLNRLIALGKPIDFMEYPNRSHCICEGAGTTLHVYSLLTRYLLTHLPAGGR